MNFVDFAIWAKTWSDDENSIGNDLMDQFFELLIVIGFGLIFGVMVMAKPFIGVVITLISLPLVDLLPPIPYFSSLVILIGAITLASFLFQRRPESSKSLFQFAAMHVVGALFVVWIFLTNPQAAWSGADRNWVLTFMQLVILSWLAGEVLNSPARQHVFMWMFAVASATSAVLAIQQGNIGDTIATSIRASGLAGNPNSTGRYLVVAMIFFTYLGSTAKNSFFRSLARVGVIVTFVGVFFTLSRTSILLLIVAIGLQITFGVYRKFSLSILILYIFAALVMWFLSSQIMNIIGSIMPSVLQGTDTAGVRYKLWGAAWRMWLDHPLQGVGIGMYPIYLKNYALGLSPLYWDKFPHNTYLSALAETGLVGFTLFSILLGLTFRNFLQRPKDYDVKSAALQKMWLIVFIVVILGEITANGLYDKLLWFLFGVSGYFHEQFSTSKQKKSKSQLVQTDTLLILKRP